MGRVRESQQLCPAEVKLSHLDNLKCIIQVIPAVVPEQRSSFGALNASPPSISFRSKPPQFIIFGWFVAQVLCAETQPHHSLLVLRKVTSPQRHFILEFCNGAIHGPWVKLTSAFFPLFENGKLRTGLYFIDFWLNLNTQHPHCSEILKHVRKWDRKMVRADIFLLSTPQTTPAAVWGSRKKSWNIQNDTKPQNETWILVPDVIFELPTGSTWELLNSFTPLLLRSPDLQWKCRDLDCQSTLSFVRVTSSGTESFLAGGSLKQRNLYWSSSSCANIPAQDQVTDQDRRSKSISWTLQIKVGHGN